MRGLYYDQWHHPAGKPERLRHRKNFWRPSQSGWMTSARSIRRMRRALSLPCSSTTSPGRARRCCRPAYVSYDRPPAKISCLFLRSSDPHHIDNSRCGVPMKGIVIDTNVFVAASFNPRSACGRILAGIREGRFQLIWNKPAQRETEMILRRIPRLDWERVADLFRPEGEFTGPVDPDAFVLVPDRDDRKFAALSAAGRRPCP